MHIKLRTALLAFAISLAALAAPAAAGAAPASLKKLDGNLRMLVSGKKPAPVNGVTLQPAARVAGGKTLVDVYVTGDIDVAARRLRALGMDVQAISRRQPERMVEGVLPVTAAPKVAALGSTRAVLSGVAGGTDTGSVLSEGDAPQRGPQARALGANGAGITVGVMSDSMNKVGGGIAGSQSTGDLPPNVTDLGDAGGGTDEGRAMGEIVYDEAPGMTNMLFDTGTTGAAAKANDIAALVSHGARVVADDTFYLTEPFFQDGVVAQSVDAAKAAGTAYITSAGNRANQSWDGTFVDGGGGLNDFGGGDTRQAVVDVPGGGGSAAITLQWDEPWGAATDDFEIHVFGNNAAAFTCSSGAPFPIVACSSAVNSGGSPIELEIDIHRVSGSGNPRMKYIARNNFGPFSIKEHATNQGAIDPDAAAAKGSLSVAAVCWSTLLGDCFGPAGLQTPESFSSRGPAVRTRDASGNPLASPEVRQKPDVAGADGVSTDLPSGGLNPFFGTSAATPSVAGVAALALSANPAMTVDQLYALLTNRANSLDCASAAGQPDTDCGAGFIQADRVVAQAKTPPAVTPALTPAAPNGANGWYRSPVTVAWNIADPNPSVLNTSGCSPTTVSSDTRGSTFNCAANGAGGTGSSSATVKLDRTPPTRLKFSGIAAKNFKRSKLPKRSRIRCSASDPISGVQGCTVSGFKTSNGPHKLTAKATNGAGETATRKLTYSVGPVCKVPKLKGKSLDAAKRALARSHCSLGKTTPRHPAGSAVVQSSSPKAGTVRRAGAKVKLTLH